MGAMKRLYTLYGSRWAGPLPEPIPRGSQWESIIRMHQVARGGEPPSIQGPSTVNKLKPLQPGQAYDNGEGAPIAAAPGWYRTGRSCYRIGEGPWPEFRPVDPPRDIGSDVASDVQSDVHTDIPWGQTPGLNDLLLVLQPAAKKHRRGRDLPGQMSLFEES